MDDLHQDQENTLRTGNRPDYLNRLKARQQDNQNIVPIAVNTETEDGGEREQSFLDSGADALQSLFQQLFSSKFNQQLPGHGHSPQAERPLAHKVFTAPKGQTVVFAEDITGGVKGITDSDSYLFITKDDDVGQGTKLRAYIVPKDDPSKQHEVSLTNTRIDQGHDAINGFRATLGEGHELVVKASGINGKTGGAWVDGKSVRSIDGVYDSYEWHALTGQYRCIMSEGVGGSHAEDAVGVRMGSFATGDSWMLVQKDSKTGRILKFTQSGTGNLGRLEVIQGDPVDKAEYVRLHDEMQAWGAAHPNEDINNCPAFKESLKKNWLDNGEIYRQAISSHEGVALPKEMVEQAVMNEGALRASIDGGFFSDGPENRALRQSISNLIDPSARQELEQREKEQFDRLRKFYDENKQGQQPTGRAFPVP